MGKGDKKTRRGKVTNGSYGKSRMRKASVPLYDKVETATEEKKEEKKAVAKKKAPAKKAAEPKAEKVEKVEPTVEKAEKVVPTEPKITAERSDKEVNAETSEKIIRTKQ